jgi:hypothetical protein
MERTLNGDPSFLTKNKQASLSASFSLLTPMLAFRYCSMISSVFEPCYPIAREACAQDRVEFVLYAYSDPTMYQRISTEVINRTTKNPQAHTPGIKRKLTLPDDARD